ncbi:MAG: glucosaminidase domain-containing protein [Erysipelotrichaceae bacterium]|nr:glucosaminidase domain-containing protein [Erysipelotrichaceae bacterium]
MKNTINYIISIFIIVYSLNFTNVLASEDLLCTITQFEIKSINDNQTSTVLACANSFEEANVFMNQSKSIYPDLIIQYKGATNPNKIIAATRGVAGSSLTTTSTLNIYETSSFSGEVTYVPNNVDMAYYETISYNIGSGVGKAKVKISGFLGFAELQNIKIVPLKYIEKGWSFEGFVYKMNEYRVSSSASEVNREIFHQTFPFPGSSNLQGTYLYGPAPSWLLNGTYYSWDGVSFYTDREMKNPVLDGTSIGKYYQYYQYLPLRSTSNISSLQLNDFLKDEGFIKKAITYTNPKEPGASVMFNEGDAFTKNQLLYGVNSLLIYAMALHESSRGTSKIAVQNNNLFGWGAVDSSPSSAKVYTSISAGIAEHMGRQIRGYLSTDNWRYFGSILGNKRNGINTKYASDPYWGQKIASWAYRIDKSANLVDYQYFKIAIIENENGRNFRPEQSTISNILYTIPKRSIEHSIIVNGMTLIDGKNWFSTTGTNPILYKSTMIAPVFSKTLEAINVNIINDQLIIPNHGFGPAGSYINLKYTGKTGDPIKYLLTSTSRDLSIGDISQLIVVDENTLQFRFEGCGRDLTSAGTGNHTFELYKEYVVTYEKSSCQMIPYYWTESTGYIQSDNFYISSPGRQFELTPGVYDESLKDEDPISSLKIHSFSDGKLIVQGIGLKKGISAPISNYVKFEIVLESESNLYRFADVSQIEDKTLTDLYGINRFNYDFTKFLGVIELSELNVGTYKLLLDAKFMPPHYETGFKKEISTLVEFTSIHSFQGKSYQLTKNIHNEVQLVVTLGDFVRLAGDVNGDGKISITDLVMLHLTISGIDTFNEFVNSNADMNSDGKISITDLVMLHLLISGIEY